ncbi:hypothetical protein [Hydrogenophaga sp. 2FB]|uniref:hypothetical protein n=1 Tax=Hydrogenophaga sp. 2FB TaxID=2502187 RepID=UPI0010F9D56C|nr:hypothetical protein [Hydrogenophaga sp. 2FB]
MSFIPKNRPVLGKDLDVMCQQYGMNTTDALFVFGLSMTRWMHIVRRDAELPVLDNSLAVLVRFMDTYPDIRILPTFPKVEDLASTMKADADILPRTFSLMMGAEETASYRWLSGRSRQSPSVLRLMWHVHHALTVPMAPEDGSEAPEGPPGLRERKKIIKKLHDLALLEAKARGAKDLIKDGRWPDLPPRDTTTPRVTKRSKAKEAAEAAGQK